MSDFSEQPRKFFMHRAHRRVGVSTGLGPSGACRTAGLAVADDARQTARVCLVVGSRACNTGGSLALLQAHLEKHYDATCSRAFRMAADWLPGRDTLEQADCLLLLGRGPDLDGRQVRRIRRFCQRGKAVVAVQVGGPPPKGWPEMDRELFGATCHGDCGNASTEVFAVDAARDHPALAGVEPFVACGALQRVSDLDSSATVLLRGIHGGPTTPVAWTRLYAGGRIFCTTLGDPHDFHRREFLRLLAGAVYWTCRKRG